MDDYTVDVISLTAISTNEQLNSLAFVMEKLLAQRENNELKNDIASAVEKIFSGDSENSNEFTLMITRKDR